VTKLNVAAGLGELMCNKYKAAARLFLSANIDHCDFPEVCRLQPLLNLHSQLLLQWLCAEVFYRIEFAFQSDSIIRSS